MTTNAQVINFIEDNQFDINNTNEWISFVGKIIDCFELKSSIFEDDEYGYGIEIATKEEKELLENIMYDALEDDITLFYVFEGNIEYGYKIGYCNKCNTEVEKEIEIPEYPYYCPNCEENMYEFEIH